MSRSDAWNRHLICVQLSKSLTIELGKDLIFEGLIEDITERKYAEEILVSKVSDLDRTNTEIDQYLYVTSDVAIN
jgi:hypothetical protein